MTNRLKRFAKTALLAPAKVLAALVVNLLQLLTILFLLFLAAGLAGWKLLSLRRANPARRNTTLGRSPVPGRQR